MRKITRSAFTVEIIEVFFETLHAVYPGEAWLHLRAASAAQLDAALEAERAVGRRGGGPTDRERLIECSRLTSVLPFEIIETLAAGGRAHDRPSAGTLLGEAMWRIDDLVDLCQDARSGALNSVLLTATEARRGVAALERLLASTEHRPRGRPRRPRASWPGCSSRAADRRRRSAAARVPVLHPALRRDRAA